MPNFSIKPIESAQIRQMPGAKAGETGLTARERAIQRLMGKNPAAGAPKAPEAPSADPAHAAIEDITSAPESPASASSPSLEGQISKSVESAMPSAEVTESSEEPISPQIALLARKEKALRAKAQQQEAAAKVREEALRAKEEALKAKEAEYQSKYIPRDRLATDLPSVLAELGMSADQITQLVLDAPKEQDVRVTKQLSTLEAQIKSLEEKLNGTTKSFEDSQKQSYDQALNQIRRDVTRMVDSDPSFELVKETNSVEDVVKRIQKTFDESGELLTIEEAAAAIESDLLERHLRLVKLKKIQEKLKSATPAEAPKPAASSPQQPQMKTLTNAASSSRRLSARERAIAAFKGERS